jgi:phospholipid/cholesterol/gamma-HCH transport system ATP-binding protein
VSAPTETPAIEVQALAKRLGTQDVLRGVDLNIRKGETCVVLGRSGCGKSVLLKHLIGLMRPSSGKVRIDGEDITDLPERELLMIRRKVGMLFQSAALFDSMTVEQNLAFPLKEHGVRDEQEIQQRVTEALEMVDLLGAETKMPEKLSGGMRKRVGLARTIVGRPHCILYDEPTTGLDPVTSDSINHLIRRLQKRLHVTSVVVTHDMKTAFHCGDSIVFLHDGRVYFHGTADELRTSTDSVIADFVQGRSGETD